MHKTEYAKNKILTAAWTGFFPLSMLAADLLTNDPSEGCKKIINLTWTHIGVVIQIYTDSIGALKVKSKSFQLKMHP